MNWKYDDWPSGEPYDWGNASRGSTIWDSTDFHVDLGCGKLKKGRIGIDRYPAPGVNIVMDLDALQVFAEANEPGTDAVQLINQEGEQVPLWCAGGAGVNYGGIYGHLERRVLDRRLPFADSSVESIISHHALEHIGEGFLPLVDEIYRVLKPGGLFYAITPLFPSHTAVADADHKRYFMDTTWDAFCGTPGDQPNECWLASFSVPYTQARFEKVHQDMSPPTPPDRQWTKDDAREIRVALKAVK